MVYASPFSPVAFCLITPRLITLPLFTGHNPKTMKNHVIILLLLATLTLSLHRGSVLPVSLEKNDGGVACVFDMEGISCSLELLSGDGAFVAHFPVSYRLNVNSWIALWGKGTLPAPGLILTCQLGLAYNRRQFQLGNPMFGEKLFSGQTRKADQTWVPADPDSPVHP